MLKFALTVLVWIVIVIILANIAFWAAIVYYGAK